MADYADVYYQSSDGLRLYARDYPCRDPGRADAPVAAGRAFLATGSCKPNDA